MKKNLYRDIILILSTTLFTIFSLRHFILGGDVAPSIDALCPFGGFETIFTLIATGKLIPRIMISSLVLGVGILLTVLLFRKGFCGWVCPFGAVQEILGKIRKKKCRLDKKKDRKARYIKYGVLAFILISTAITGTLLWRDVDPFMTFFHFGKGLLWGYEPNNLGIHVFGAGVTLAILGASVYIPRFFCRYLCPLGATMNLFTWLGRTKIERNDTCIDCKLCDKACPMSVKVSDVDHIRDNECINCNQCVNVCPKSSLEIKTGGIKISSITYGIAVVFVFFLVVFMAKGAGVWQSLPILPENPDDFNSVEIKGWMTLDQVAAASGININHFLQDFRLPETVVDMPIREIKDTAGVEVHAEDMREYVDNFVHDPTHHQEESLLTTEVKEKKDVLCPWELHDDPYPGQCGLYRDSDSNGICDLSE